MLLSPCGVWVVTAKVYKTHWPFLCGFHRKPAVYGYDSTFFGKSKGILPLKRLFFRCEPPESGTKTRPENGGTPRTAEPFSLPE